MQGSNNFGMTYQFKCTLYKVNYAEKDNEILVCM